MEREIDVRYAHFMAVARLGVAILMSLFIFTFSFGTTEAYSRQDRGLVTHDPRLSQSISIPKIVYETSTIDDISGVDWNQYIDLSPTTTVKLRSKEARSFLDISPNLNELLNNYDDDRTYIEDKLFILPHNRAKELAKLDSAYTFLIRQKLINGGNLPIDYFTKQYNDELYPAEQLIDVSGTTTKKLDITSGEKGSVRVNALLGDISKREQESDDVTGALYGLFGRIKHNVSNLFSYANLHIVGAQGITPEEEAIQYLLSVQNVDGSFGQDDLQFVNTVAAVDTFYELGYSTSTAGQEALSWINFHISDNNDYLAEKIRVLGREGEYVNDLALYLASEINSGSGGIPFDANYEPDPQTTAHTLRSLTEINYTDSVGNPDHTISLMLYYLISKQNFDGGWSSVLGGNTSVRITADILQALTPYRGITLSGFAGGDIFLDDTINKATLYLKNSQSPDGTWNSNVLDTATSFAVLKKAGNKPFFETETREYLEGIQGIDGSFSSGDVYITARAAMALKWGGIGSYGNIKINDIIPLSNLETSLAATTSIQVSLTNTGDVDVSDGTLHLFSDNVHIGQYDFSQLGIVIASGSTELFTVDLSSTFGFVEDVEFNLFFEGVGDIVHYDSWYTETLAFSSNQNNLPGLPVYFIAHRHDVNGLPSLNVRWQQKDDPNRSEYMIMWRIVGDTLWNTLAIPNDWNGAFLYPFTEGETYEATVGARALNGIDFIYFDKPVLVTTSSSPSNHTGNISGEVRDIGIPFPNVGVSGFGIGSTAGQDGAFTEQNIDNGKNVLWVSDIQYDSLISIFPVDTNMTTQNIIVHTRLVPDITPPIINSIVLTGASSGSVYNQKQYFIYANGMDNIGVESGIFYYYDPNDSQWHLLGSASSPNYVDTSYAWDIPANLLGTGFKVKAILSDFSGNISVEKIFGPFEIKQGNTKPTLTFIEPDGIDDTADQTFMINWIDDDPDSDAMIRLYYDDDNIFPLDGIIVSNLSEDDLLDQYLWDTSALPNGQYYISANLDDNFNSNVWVYNQNPITVTHATGTVNVSPTIDIIEPDGIGDMANASYMINWLASDPDNNASIDLYYDTDSSGEDGILISSGIEEDVSSYYLWDTTAIPDGGIYYIYAIINDGINPSVIDYSSGAITINHNIPPTIMITEPDGVVDSADKTYTIAWNATDPDNDASISLYYDTNNVGFNGTLIKNNISENASSTHLWNTTSMSNGRYYIYAEIDDGINQPIASYGAFPVTVRHKRPGK